VHIIKYDGELIEGKKQKTKDKRFNNPPFKELVQNLNSGGLADVID
jgi:hypothetical protein